MVVDNELLRILVCPVSGAPLVLSQDERELICVASRLAYPIEDGVPIMLVDKARTLTANELEEHKK